MDCQLQLYDLSQEKWWNQIHGLHKHVNKAHSLTTFDHVMLVTTFSSINLNMHVCFTWQLNHTTCDMSLG